MKRNIMMKYTYMYVPTKPLFQKKKKLSYSFMFLHKAETIFLKIRVLLLNSQSG